MRDSTPILPCAALRCHHRAGYDPQVLVGYVEESGCRLHVERAGSLFMPPGVTQSKTTWERVRDLREGRYAVLEADPLLDHGAAPKPETLNPSPEP